MNVSIYLSIYLSSLFARLSVTLISHTQMVQDIGITSHGTTEYSAFSFLTPHLVVVSLSSH